MTLDGTLFIPVRTGGARVSNTCTENGRRDPTTRKPWYRVRGSRPRRCLLTVLAQAHVERAVRCALRRARGRVRHHRRSARAGRRRRRRRSVTAVTGWTVTLVAGLLFRTAERSVIGPEPVRFHSSFALDFLLVAVHLKRRYVYDRG